MNWIKNKWLLLVAVLLVLATTGFVFRQQLWALFGGYETSELGYKYRFVKGHKLDKIKGPDYHIIYQYVMLDPKGDTLENGSKNGVQQQRPYPTEVKNFIDEAMQIAAPGSVVEILVPSDTLMEHDPDNIKIATLRSGENAKFVIHVMKVLNAQEFEEYKNQRLVARVVQENRAIDAFAAKKTDVQWLLDSAKWIKYYIDNKTDKPRLENGDVIEFNAEVYTLDGKMIGGSVGGKKFKATIGRQELWLYAFDVVALYLADGEEGFFLVTSDYGYGDKGYLNIVKPYEPLAVIMRDVKKLKK